MQQYPTVPFKRVNDVHGHLIGDHVLQGIAAVTRKVGSIEGLSRKMRRPVEWIR
jgi:hypothetical protein